MDSLIEEQHFSLPFQEGMDFNDFKTEMEDPVLLMLDTEPKDNKISPEEMIGHLKMVGFPVTDE